jgi:hypothetical protein
MDGSKEHPLITAGLDLGDKYSYHCAPPSASEAKPLNGRRKPKHSQAKEGEEVACHSVEIVKRRIRRGFVPHRFGSLA